MFLFRFLLLNTILLFKLNYSFVTYKSTVTIGSTKAIFRHGFKRFAESDDRGFDSVIEYAQKIDKDTKNCTSDINESNLNIDENTLHAELLSSIGIVGGTTVGAGVLALPTFASDSGFLPSSFGILGSWVYMVMTGLLISEVTIGLATKDDLKGKGYLSSVRYMLGDTASYFAGACYIFLHYALIVAYAAEGGELFSNILSKVHISTGESVGSILYVAIVASLIKFGSTKTVDSVNNSLCLLLCGFFAVLLYIGIPNISADNLLAYQNFKNVPSSLPIFLLSLVYHNIVPTISMKLDYKKDDIQKALWIGTALPVVMFILWDAVVLGMNSNGRVTISKGADPILSMFQGLELGNSLFSVSDIVGGFSILAITTSFIGFIYGLTDFWGDILNENGSLGENKKSVPILAVTLLPPLLVALIDPNIFLNALDAAGAFGVCALFGALPPVMAWKQRKENEKEKEKYTNMTSGNDVTLYLIFGSAIAVMTQKIVTIFNN